MTSTYRSAGVSVEAVATRAAEKILPEGVEIFIRLLVLPLGLCFCEQSGGMTKTALPIRFKPAWAGLTSFNLKTKNPHRGFCLLPEKRLQENEFYQMPKT